MMVQFIEVRGTTTGSVHYSDFEDLKTAAAQKGQDIFVMESGSHKDYFFYDFGIRHYWQSTKNQSKKAIGAKK